MIRALLFTLMGILAGSSSAQTTRSTDRFQQYKSLDGALMASVRSTSGDSVESKVEISTATGRRLVLKQYFSEDGAHGYAVVQGKWTPDSRFFVFALESSGGHSPWHSPVEYFDRSSSTIFSLDDALDDAVTTPDFNVSAPDKVTVSLWFSHREKTVSLSKLKHPR